MAEYYSADLAEKVSRGMTENALKARFNGGQIPLGFTIDDEQHYQIDPEKAPLVIEMFRRYAGGESITDIIEDLNARGIRTSQGNRFNKNSLARIFSNRRYIGEYAYKEIVFSNAIPAIVPKEIFERVAIRMKQNKHATGKAKAPERYLLTTKLFCGTCQSMFVGDSANKPNGVIYRYYKCASAKRHECDRKAIRKEWIEDKVIEQISAWLNNDKLLSDMADDVMALLNEDDEMILALEAQLREVQSSIDNIMKAIEKGVVTRSTKSRLEELEAEEEKITLSIKLEEAKRPKITKEFIIFTLNKFRNLDLRFEKNKERLIDGLVKAIFVYDDYIKLILTFDDKPINIPTSDEIENMANSSDIQSSVSPKKERVAQSATLSFFGDALRARTPERSEDRRFAILRSKMTALAVKQNSALSEAKQRFPYGLHSKRMGSHFASKAEPSLLGLATSKNIRRRRNSRTFSSAHEPPNEVRTDVLRFLRSKMTALAVKQNSALNEAKQPDIHEKS